MVLYYLLSVGRVRASVIKHLQLQLSKERDDKRSLIRAQKLA